MGLHMTPEGYYLLPLSGLCTIVFFAGLVVFVKTMKSRKEIALQPNEKELTRIVKGEKL